MSAANVKIEAGLETATSVPEAGQQPDTGSGTGTAGGVYFGRELSRTGAGHRSISRSRTRDSNVDIEEGGDWRRDDGRRKQVFRGKTLLW